MPSAGLDKLQSRASRLLAPLRPLDAGWLVLFALAWWLAAGLHVPPATALLLGLASALLLCKLLSMSPLLRPCAALAPLLPCLSVPSDFATAAMAGSAMGAAGYGAFTLLRLSFYAVRAYRFRTPEGQDDGWDYGQLLLAQERLLAWLRPRSARRILFPATAMETGLRESFRHRSDILRFAELTPDNLRGQDLVVPLQLPDMETLRRHASLLPRSLLPLPDPACVALCDDKLRFHHAMLAASFGQYLPEIADALPFPYVLKKRNDAWGVNTHIIASHDDELRHAGQLRDADYFRQAMIPGRREYATHLLMRDGRVAAAITMEYTYAHDLHKKCREQLPHYTRLRRSTHLGLFRDMLTVIGFEGLCCVNYKLHQGQPRIFEINPRFGGSLSSWFFVMMRKL